MLHLASYYGKRLLFYPLSSMFHFNELIASQIKGIVDLQVTKYFIANQKDIKAAGRYKTNDLYYFIVLKNDTIPKRNKIGQLEFDLEKLKLPFNVFFQFASKDLYKMVELETII